MNNNYVVQLVGVLLVTIGIILADVSIPARFIFLGMILIVTGGMNIEEIKERNKDG